MYAAAARVGSIITTKNTAAVMVFVELFIIGSEASTRPIVHLSELFNIVYIRPS